jgi:dolichol-phosphate mannosyltransferase
MAKPNQGGRVREVGPELSVIVPTFNERENVGELVARLEQCLEGLRWEVLFVDDDSPDGTSDLARELAREDRRVRCIQRIGRRGLSTACIEGMLATSAPYLAVIDGDLQHDERLLPEMLAALRSEDLDVVVGSRYVAGGGVGDWDERRAAISRFATRVGQRVIQADLTDPMSGFFMIRRDAFHGAARRVSGLGFKILMDLFASSPEPLKFKELPYEFRTRQAGESKLDSQAAWEFGMLLADKTVGRWIPVRFLAFSAVGGIGVVSHFAVLTLLFKGLGAGFVLSQAAATLVAMTGNFVLNNLLTYRDQRLRRWQWLRGWLSFNLVCGVGALANVGIASYLFARDTFWILSAVAGIVVGAVWNYAVTAVYTWNRPRRD